MNEAINGVFRSEKSDLKKAKKGNKSLQTTSNENLKKQTTHINKGQKTLKQMMIMKEKKNLQSNHASVDKENSTVEENNQDNE